ncbi:MAG: hypothetical protein H6830_04940 [Planctomycetes bacterium]|nr:hypothetical protein [Planctomycetota bacterium]MCB9909167.1 hypothetical protein [Planctomycetota bacterium]HPF15039.1 hypothetical protein [Planctomycetota bacterium]
MLQSNIFFAAWLCAGTAWAGGGPAHLYDHLVQDQARSLVSEGTTPGDSPRVDAHHPQGAPANGLSIDQAWNQVKLIELFDHTSVLEQARVLTPAERLARFDRDFDGFLRGSEARQAAEDQAQRSARMAELVARFDDNRNGRLDASEMSRARAEADAARRKEILSRYDRNQDGVLDPVERRQVSQDRVLVERLLPLIPRFDTNRNQRLEPAEQPSLVHYLTAEGVPTPSVRSPRSHPLNTGKPNRAGSMGPGR